MTDISKCVNEDCPSKEKCWRYVAPGSEYQSYANFDPKGEEKCEYFWDINDR